MSRRVPPRLTSAQSADRWRRYYPRLKTFQAEHGHIQLPYGGPLLPLKAWLQSQIQEARSPDYAPKRRMLLEALGFQFEADIDVKVWHLRMSQLREYIAAKSTWRVGPEEPELQLWLSVARRQAREGSVPPYLVSDLKALGVPIGYLPRGPSAQSARLPAPASEEYGADWDAPETERPR
ncbi:helicase associated domain-containing protein [Variovorax sp. LjRoot175]|uniref:helicase associated domain-containing protein n=1 Tax=Variovorax sp. LjRoot175 TaxID=3342276 RepID=UPI003F51A4D0